ncbi:ribonuclease P 40kDa subunit-domain-containing protein [Cladochytrium replicatum]|nr:ribonuclease P 40kDa subunit-domain-containing protein [Cladochytrium replicatum]
MSHPRLYVSKSNLPNEDGQLGNLLENVVRNHTFNCCVQVLVPGSHEPQFFEDLITSGSESSFYFLARNCPLSTFISPDFLSETLMKGRFCALSIHSRIDSGDVFALLPSGLLILNVTKDTYEQLGLTGKASSFGKRFQIVIDLTDSKFKPGNKMFDRVSWCFQNPLNGTFDFVLSLTDSETGSSLDLNLPTQISIEKRKIEVEKRMDTDVFVPNFSEGVSNGNSSNRMDVDDDQIRKSNSGGAPALEVSQFALDSFEWLGMVASASPRLNTKRKVDPSIAVYEPPIPSTISSVISIRLKGLISPERIGSIVRMARTEVKQWVAVLVWGVKDSPVSWGTKEHGFLLNGENHYAAVILDESGEVDRSALALVYRCVGEYDQYTV